MLYLSTTNPFPLVSSYPTPELLSRLAHFHIGFFKITGWSCNTLLFLTTDTKEVVPIVAIPVATDIAVVQVPVPRVAAIVGASRPEVAVVAVIVGRAIVGVARKLQNV